MKTYFDIQGDGGSDVLGQVQAQQAAIEEAMAGVGRVVAIGSGKGGVGKSTITMALAHALNRRGQRLAIFDADFNGPCQARLAGLSDVPWIPGENGLAVPRRADGIGVVSMGSVFPGSTPVTFSSFAEGGEHHWRATREFAVLGQLLAGVDWGELDLLLFDLPPGAERTLQYADFFGPNFLGKGVDFALVTIPSEVSHGVVARSIRALDEAPCRLVGYIENMVGYYHHEEDRVLPLFPPSETELDLPCLGQVPFDPHLAAACDQGWPEKNEALGRSLAAIDTVAENLLRTLEV